jgi:hypothetical protein
LLSLEVKTPKREGSDRARAIRMENKKTAISRGLGN